MTFELIDYRVFARQHPGEFDRIISCEMIEVSINIIMLHNRLKY